MSNKKNIWSFQEEQQLFLLHSTLRKHLWNEGNKWASIAMTLGTKDQSTIKNKFYSTLRKGFRKINKYITDIKRKSDLIKFKSLKTIQEIFISKLISVSDSNYIQKYEVKQRAIQLAAGNRRIIVDIQQELIAIARSEEEYVSQSKTDYNIQEKLLGNIMEFNKNCKKRKGKRKEVTQKGKQQNNDIDEEVEESENQLKNQQLQIPVQQKPNQQDPIEDKNPKQPEFKMEFSSFLDNLQKKQPTSKIVNLFSHSANQFLKNCEYFQAEEGLLLQSSSNMTHSACLKNQESGWLYESTESKRQKNIPYLVQSSHYPSDNSSPFTFANIMKAKNITNSTMFDNVSCADDLACSGAFLRQSQQSSFLSQVPIAKVKSGEFLIKSADLKMQLNLEHNQQAKQQIIPTFCIPPYLDNFNPNYKYQDYADEYVFAENNISTLTPSTAFTEGSAEFEKPFGNQPK